MWNKISDVGMPRPGDYSVLAYHTNGSVEMVHCDDLNWSAGLCLYTHWMELPSPPTAEKQGAEPVHANNSRVMPCLMYAGTNEQCDTFGDGRCGSAACQLART